MHGKCKKKGKNSLIKTSISVHKVEYMQMTSSILSFEVV